jgi:hypothetical protein
MQLRNQKDTVELTVEELKREVYPDNLDMPYSWPAAPGEPVWVKVDGRWKKGVVLQDKGHAWTDRVSIPFPSISCLYDVAEGVFVFVFAFAFSGPWTPLSCWLGGP